jgi:hypothetical protein
VVVPLLQVSFTPQQDGKLTDRTWLTGRKWKNEHDQIGEDINASRAEEASEWETGEKKCKVEAWGTVYIQREKRKMDVEV